VLAFAQKLKAELEKKSFAGRNLVIHIDNRDLRSGEKNWEWIKKGVPLRIEIGPRDVDNGACMVSRRDQMAAGKKSFTQDELSSQIEGLLAEMQQNYFSDAGKLQQTHIRTDLKDFAELQAYFTPKNLDKPEIHGGFVLAKWCGDAESTKVLEELKVTIRCLPLKQSGTTGRCILTGKPATLDALFAKSY
jgi:prolyl-tRNA synthetase